MCQTICLYVVVGHELLSDPGDSLCLFYPVLDPFLFGSGTTDVWLAMEMLVYYVILALGLNIVVGFAGLLDLGYVAFFAIGAYAWGIIGSSQLSLLTGITV